MNLLTSRHSGVQWCRAVAYPLPLAIGPDTSSQFSAFRPWGKSQILGRRDLWKGATTWLRLARHDVGDAACHSAEWE